MAATSTTTRASTPSLDNTRGRVFAEHERLRRLMLSLVRAATTAIHDEKAMAEVRDVLTELVLILSAHLDYEDDVIVPLVSSTGDQGRMRAMALVDDHRAQRAIVRALLDDARAGVRPPADLIDELGWFVRALERDIGWEEEMILSQPPFALG
jgi:hemerythrin-like domain-containing protein